VNIDHSIVITDRRGFFRMTSKSILFAGDEKTGKTSVILRWAKDQFSEKKQVIDSETHTVQCSNMDRMIRLTAWDTHDSRYGSLNKGIARNAHCIVLCFDASDKSSAEHLKFWREQMMHNLGKYLPPFCIVGCKSDIPNDNQSEEIARKIAREHFGDCAVLMTSSKTGHGVREAFQSIASACVQSDKKNDAEKLDLNATSGAKRCAC